MAKKKTEIERRSTQEGGGGNEKERSETRTKKIARNDVGRKGERDRLKDITSKPTA